ncbi:MAG TPA: pyridoxamine 5'-phosphate oxidase family protein [Hyphomicrobiaceae bacterium]|nr:pyridoxamine 5'-phosphate oxidase family protein [Hyphomicrobiaceae bacterium]
MTTVTSIDALRRLYDMPQERAVKKELTRLDRHHKSFIALSPFLVISSTGANGQVDASPRGDRAGFVQVLNDATITIPDWPGNNRLDTLTNIIERPQVGLLFLIPGVTEQMRVNGRAVIDTEESLRRPFETRGKLPKSVIRVSVEQAYLHCSKAIMRSSLWDESRKVDRSVLPTLTEMLRDQTGIASSEADLQARYQKTLY